MFGRILSNTKKHIRRSGWIGIASVFVMTLAFLVASIFGGLAYVANLYIDFIEGKSNMLVFFEVGVDQQIVRNLQAKWQNVPGIKSISYLSEEEAYEFYSEYTARVVPEQFQILSRFSEKKLPSSLEIQLRSLDDIDSVQNVLSTEIDAENAKLITYNLNETQPDSESDNESAEESEGEESVVISESSLKVTYLYSEDPEKPPINLVVDNENLQTLKSVFFALRLAGLVTLALLFLFVSIFIFMTVEFRLYNQKEEIGVMQLVGGSLVFIRAPYILEGGFYGAVGALMSTALLGSVLASVFVFNKDWAITRFLYDNFGQLNWPDLGVLGLVIVIALLTIIGFILGALSSYLSIRRYIR